MVEKKDNKTKTSVFITKGENWDEFKKIVRSKGVTLQGVFDNFIRKVVEKKIDILDILKD